MEGRQIMKKIIAGVLCTALAASLAGMCSFADETEAASNGLATDGKLVVGFDAEYPPYC